MFRAAARGAARGAKGVAAACLLLALAGCLPTGGGGLAGGKATPKGTDPMTGDRIEVSELAPSPAAGPAAPPAPTDAPRPKARPAPDPAPDPGPDPGQAPEKPGGTEAAAADAPPPPVPAEAEPEAAKSEAQIACERRKGVWADAGSGLRACVSSTRDAGKACRKAGDCEGECLARSGTCAPFTPLFGCNEVFDDTGRRMTQCLD